VRYFKEKRRDEHPLHSIEQTFISIRCVLQMPKLYFNFIYPRKSLSCKVYKQSTCVYLVRWNYENNNMLSFVRTNEAFAFDNTWCI